MPKVKYLKDLCSGKTGTVRDLQQYEVNVLLRLGAVELFEDNLPNDQKVLLNPNGTPVVDNFGSFVHVPNDVESPLKKGKKVNKG